jgi:hypothetical protein
MTKFVSKQLNTLGALLFCALASVLLQGCGAERTTPFDPDNSSSSSSQAVSVDVAQILVGTEPHTDIDHKEKNLNVMRDEDEYVKIGDYYVSTGLDEQNFDDGQVVLIDMGDTDGCKQHLTFSSLTAKEAGDDSVKVVIKYNEVAAGTSNCSSTNTRPFYFYYVRSRGALVFEENIN